MPQPLPPQDSERPQVRGGRVQSGSIILIVTFLIYVLSMVPVGRLYVSGLLQPDTWHMQSLVAFYYPLLYLTSHNKMAYVLTVKYSNIWATFIPSEVSRKGLNNREYVQSWWFMNRFRTQMSRAFVIDGQSAGAKDAMDKIYGEVGRDFADSPREQ